MKILPATSHVVLYAKRCPVNKKKVEMDGMSSDSEDIVEGSGRGRGPMAKASKRKLTKGVMSLRQRKRQGNI